MSILHLRLLTTTIFVGRVLYLMSTGKLNICREEQIKYPLVKCISGDRKVLTYALTSGFDISIKSYFKIFETLQRNFVDSCSRTVRMTVELTVELKFI